MTNGTQTITEKLMTLTNPTSTPPRTVAKVITAARQAQRLTLQEFSATLGANSKQNVFNWESGASEPGRDILAAWYTDERQWVNELAQEIFVARYRQSIETFRLKPNAKAARALYQSRGRRAGRYHYSGLALSAPTASEAFYRDQADRSEHSEGPADPQVSARESA